MTSQGIELYTGQKSVGYTERDGTVVVHTKSGAEFAGTALIGCDGIHSKLAPLVSGNPQESELCGTAVWSSSAASRGGGSPSSTGGRWCSSATPS